MELGAIWLFLWWLLALGGMVTLGLSPLIAVSLAEISSRHLQGHESELTSGGVWAARTWFFVQIFGCIWVVLLASYRMPPGGPREIFATGWLALSIGACQFRALSDQRSAPVVTCLPALVQELLLLGWVATRQHREPMAALVLVEMLVAAATPLAWCGLLAASLSLGPEPGPPRPPAPPARPSSAALSLVWIAVMVFALGTCSNEFSHTSINLIPR